MFGTIESARIKRMRQKVLDAKLSICTERAKIITHAYKKYQSQPIVLKRALALKDILESMSLYIMDDELIVGNHSSAIRAAPIFPEYSMDWVIKELDEFEKRPSDRYTITEQAKDELRSIYPSWKNNTLIDYGLAMFPEESLKAYENGVIRAEGNLTSGDGHLAPDYGKLLKLGMKGVKKLAQQKLSSLDFDNADQLKQSYFLRAVIIALDAVTAFSKRFSLLAKNMQLRKQTLRESRSFLI